MRFRLCKSFPRKYVFGRDLKVGDYVWFRPSGRHCDFFGEVCDGFIRIISNKETPEYLHGAKWGLWPDHRYLLDNSFFEQNTVVKNTKK